jgi:hypothetical protein
MCPGSEGADLKSVELKGFAGANPVHGVEILVSDSYMRDISIF